MRGIRGIEPRTSETQTLNHTTRPNPQRALSCCEEEDEPIVVQRGRALNYPPLAF